MNEGDLYSRQRALREIGSAGQARLGAAAFCPSSELTAEGRRMAILYARAAGWGEISSPRGQPTPSAASVFRHRAARDIGSGALDVLSCSLPLFDLAPNSPEK